MQPRPVIGIATQTHLPGPGQQLPPCWIMGQRYVRVLASASAVPWLVPLLSGDEATLRALYDRLDGVFLTGGVDVDPSCYGEERHPLCGATDADRDWTELRLVRWAVEEGKPVLGVCRGIQLLNVAAGGTLYQDVTAQHPQAIKHDYFPAGGFARDQLTHTVRLVERSRLAGLLESAEVAVNSMHHQGIKALAPGLVATALAPDGLIEAVEGRNGQFLVGVQWHPEELAEGDAPMRRLFTAFVEAATSGFRGPSQGDR